MAEAEKTKGGMTEFERVDLEFKKMQIELFREQMAERNEKKAALAVKRDRQVADFKKSEDDKRRRQSACRHRKGGRDNKNFHKGDGTQYCINLNTYPDGRMVIMCTRCWKEVEKPSRELRKTNPKLYEQMWEQWQAWSQFPTDNSPSGGKIFEIERAA